MHRGINPSEMSLHGVPNTQFQISLQSRRSKIRSSNGAEWERGGWEAKRKKNEV